jgi:hypothetical protein
VSLHAAPAAVNRASSPEAYRGWEALLFALAGGVVLNLMPCVFPVLSLKLLSLAGIGDRAAHHHAAAYAAGVILSFAALGGALLILRAGGAAIGWGFQLQSPVVVGLLAYLLFAMGLSLSGVADFGAGLAGVGRRSPAGRNCRRLPPVCWRPSLRPHAPRRSWERRSASRCSRRPPWRWRSLSRSASASPRH